MSGAVDLRMAWAGLLERRRSLAASLAPYGALLEAWARPAPDVGSLDGFGPRAQSAAEHGLPLLSVAPPPLTAASLEEMLGTAMEMVARLSPSRAPALQRLADAWDAGAILPTSLLPTVSGIGDGTVERLSGLDSDAVAFLGWATLRPVLDAWFRRREAEPERDWDRGVCPLCGAPPGFSEIVEDGHRRLACHFCGANWRFARLRCPLCGAEATSDLRRLLAEGAEAGYAISGCGRCGGYVKELDRRERWNGSVAILEDWGSPHLDVVARSAGYRKAVPILLDLAEN